MTKRKIQTIQTPRGKDRQYNDQEEQINNTMIKRKRQDNTMTKRKRQTIQRSRGKDRHCNDQEEKTDNTINKRKRQTTQ
jgi:hypothetical protein